jgi:hypothetical protein
MMVVVDVARWPGFLFNAQSITVCRCAMYEDATESLYSSLGVEVDV